MDGTCADTPAWPAYARAEAIVREEAVAAGRPADSGAIDYVLWCKTGWPGSWHTDISEAEFRAQVREHFAFRGARPE